MNGKMVKNGLTALAVEARRRGVSYGQLVAATTEWEQQEIIWEYMGGPKELGMEWVPKQEGERICPAHGTIERDPT